ncbi:hypothetical protein KQI84_18710 [bacterium]|nr:hypothetical protein [bacterium]
MTISEETRLCEACNKQQTEDDFGSAESNICKRCAKKEQRQRLLKSANLLQTTRTAPEIYGIYNRLYHLDYSEDDPDRPWVANYPRLIYSTRHGKKEWVTVPSKWEKTPEKALKMARKYAGDVQFKMGVGTRDLERKWIYAIEVDADKGRVDEKNMWALINERVLRHFERLGIRPHLMLTGRRSVHAQWFFKEPLNREQIQSFRLLAGKIFKGKADKDTEVNSLRVAGIMHSGTGEISRYPGNRTLDDVLDYMESIEPVRVTDEIIERLKREIGIKGPVVKEIVGVALKREEEERREERDNNIVALTNIPSPEPSITEVKGHTLDSGLHRFDYLDIIPPHKSCEVLFKTSLVFDTYRENHGCIEATRKALIPPLRAGARSEEVFQERLERLEDCLSHLPEYRPSARPKLEYTSKDDSRIKNALRRLRRLLRRGTDFKGMNKVARYVYRQILDYGGEADLGVNQIAKETGYPTSTVATWMRQLSGMEGKSVRLFHCEDEFSPPMADNRTRCWRIKGVECLRKDQDRRWTELQRWIRTGEGTDAILEEIIARNGKPTFETPKYPAAKEGEQCYDGSAAG